ncbi:hypothetical protein [Flammeovirga sp. OC4]|uniref:hypothetical protein n=1 Tax=Flammeovirga sp. OC4 TaxID=1382345 RepID=UPI0005C4CFD2|nr:hypothetical protein [Flammeovirga sp. OC4]
MTENEIINKAIQELKLAQKPYLMFKEFSFLSGLEWGEDKFQKIRYLLIKSSPFEKHTDHAIKLSEVGLEIANNHKDWFAYRKSLEPKTDYVKWIGVSIAGLSLVWNVYQGISNSKLRDDNQTLREENTNLIKKLENLNK